MAEGAEGDAAPADRATALLDLLAGWLEMVETCREAADLPREEFDREFFGEVVPETYEEWRGHYTDDYLATVAEIYELAGGLVLGDEEEPELSPAEFLRAHVLPLFEEETG